MNYNKENGTIEDIAFDEDIEVIGVKFKDAGKVYYFSPNKQDFSVGDNVIVLSDSITTVKAGKWGGAVDAAELFANPITAKAWGEPTISVNADSYNTALYAHNDTPDGTEADFYFRWDDTYLYIGMTSPDPYFLGSNGGSYEGDGIQFLIEPRVTAVTGEKFNLSVNQNSRGQVVFSEHSGKWTAEQKNQVIKNVIYEADAEGSNSGTVNVMLAIPHSILGLEEAEIKAGAIFFRQ